MSYIQKSLLCSVLLCLAVLPSTAQATSSSAIARQSSEGSASSQHVRRGARNVKIFSYPLRSGCASAARVQSLTAVYEGASPKDFYRVYASVQSKKVSRNSRIDPKSMTMTVTFPSSPLLQACSGNTIDFFASIARTATPGTMHRFMIELPSDVYTDEGNIGDPIQGPWIEIAKE